MEIQGFGLSHIGKKRSRNEDAIYMDPRGRFAILADGIGGHLGGAEASQKAVEICADELEAWPNEVWNKSPDELIFTKLQQLFTTVSEQFAEQARKHQYLKDMGTTLIAWLNVGQKFLIAHVGDSRALLAREGRIFLLTLDHTFENEAIRRGASSESVRNMPHGQVLVRSIGANCDPTPERTIMDALPDDVWILCSDGLTNRLELDEILSLIDKEDLEISTKKLVQAAYDRGGDDNISVLLIRAL